MKFICILFFFTIFLNYTICNLRKVKEGNLTKLAKKLGLKIFVWGWPEHSGFVYNVDLIVKLINWKIDGFITDKPDELRSLLYKMGYSVPSQIKVI